MTLHMVHKLVKKVNKFISRHSHKLLKVNGGFLLPTVIILGLGIGTVSVVAMQSVARNSVLLNDQYYNSVAREAAQAGVNAAAACIRSGTRAWTDANRLKPSTDCNGVTVASKSLTVADDSIFSSSYEVKPLDAPTTDTILVTSIGKVSIKGPGGITVKTITKSIRTFAKSTAPYTTRTSKAVAEISVGPSTACAVAEGWAYCWGSNANGMLGIGKNIANNRSTSPIAVAQAAVPAMPSVPNPCGGFFQPACSVQSSPAIPANPMVGKKVTKISVGTTHVCAIATNGAGADGKAYCWGNNASGQLGDRSTTSSSVPVAVDTLAADYTPPPVTPNPCGGFFQPACTPVVQPTQPKSDLAGKTVVDITAGNNFTCALTSDGNVACWGDNANGQLGNNSRTDYSYPKAIYKHDTIPAVPGTPAIPSNPNPCGGFFQPACITPAVPAVADVPEVPATPLFGKTVAKLAKVKNGSTMCVIGTDEKAYCWGQNYSGQVGNGGHGVTQTASGTCSGGATDYPDIPLTTAYDALQPALVQTTLLFDSITTGGGGSSSSAYTTGKTSGSSVNPNRIYWWGGSSSTSTSRSICGSTGGNDGGSGQNKYIGRTTRTYTYQSVPGGPVYNDPAGTGLNQKQLGFMSGGIVSLFCAQTGSDIYCDPHGDGTQQGQTGNGTVVTCVTEWWGGQTCNPTIPDSVQRVYMDGFLSGKTIQAMDTGSGYTCVVANTQVGCWGKNDNGQLGIGDGTPPAGCTSAGCFAPTPLDVTVDSDIGEETTVNGSAAFDNPVSF
jgi:alpha-tubulin suppressor-like RCC1 family protein